MELTRGLNNWQPRPSGCVATIGNFDGVHLGHKAIFAQLTTLATEHKLPSVVITFEPLPHEYFDESARDQRLQTFRDRVLTIAACGIDHLLFVRFNADFARQQPDVFVDAVLREQLGVRHLLVGDDFRFGHQRAGSIQTLRDAQADGRFSVTDTATIEHAGSRVSSTRVRGHLQRNECDAVIDLLGRPHRISGRVCHGQKLARQLGYPTANIALKRHRPLLRGVFAVEARTPDGKHWPAVANLGERPTVDGKELRLEVHLLDQEQDLYGQVLGVDFRQFIRGEKKFDSLDELKAAIVDDADTARRFFSSDTDQARRIIEPD
ncbi:MAG: bifunctional riboflavin kinase/FAD synthetase [Gammaproteobacteria bacterium]|nr:bifunctional riboflavin kinase/FAD synthetase [Gammaproteobacteria bacterium]